MDMTLDTEGEEEKGKGENKEALNVSALHNLSVETHTAATVYITRN